MFEDRCLNHSSPPSTDISDRIIAMGFPASKIEGIFRNNIDDVAKFLETNHKDRYKLYNLCSERHYDPTRFHNRVAHFPFDDHNPPKIDLIKPFCDDVTSWLEKDAKNIVAIHCKAGKGRTGVMICCYLLHSSRASSAKEALDIYDLKRTRDNKGVTIPSQRRYVEYYEALVKKNEVYQAVPLTPVSISFSPLPLVNGGNFSFNFTIYQTGKDPDKQSDSGRVSHVKVFRSETLEARKNHEGRFVYSFPEDCLVSVAGDVRVEFKYKDVLQVVKKKTTFFSFWFNTFFVRSPPGHSFSSTDSSSSSLSSRRLSGNNTDEPIAANGHCRPFSDSSQRLVLLDFLVIQQMILIHVLFETGIPAKLMIDL